jgi:hypothetical protein
MNHLREVTLPNLPDLTRLNTAFINYRMRGAIYIQTNVCSVEAHSTCSRLLICRRSFVQQWFLPILIFLSPPRFGRRNAVRLEVPWVCLG